MSDWTPDIEADLRRWYVEDGKQIKQVGALIKEKYKADFSKGAIAGRIHKLGLQRRGKISPKMQRSTLTSLPVRSEPAPAYREKIIDTAEPPKRKTLMQLGPRECMWPITEGSPFFFCGHRVKSDSRYCETHHKAAHEGGPKSAKDLIRSAGGYR